MNVREREQADADLPPAPAAGMNGAESLVATLAASGVDTCFANPGTSEMHFVAALDRVAGVRCVLTLFEGVATGAADGYWRMAGKPAATLLHLGPGLANGGANLHNAQKARSGILNVVGDHATWHGMHESPLRSDVLGIARPFSHWLRSARSARDVARDAADAVAATRAGAAGAIATLVLPADTAWGEGSEPVQAAVPQPPAAPRPTDVSAAAEALREGGAAATLLLGGPCMADPRALALAAAIARHVGCDLLSEFYSARVAAGRGRARVERLPYAVDAAVARLAPTRQLVLAGSAAPVAFFAYPDKPSLLAPPDCTTVALSGPEDDTVVALQALADALDVPQAGRGAVPDAAPPAGVTQAGDEPLTADFVGRAVAAMLPENAIVVDEAISSGRSFAPHFSGAAPHDWLAVMGGAIGFGLPAALGAAVAAPGRTVVALEGDGSGMYTVQALWSMARERVPVVVVIFANRAYRILQGELQGVGATISGPKARDMLSLDRPALDWTALARGMGVQGERADTAAGFCEALQRALASGLPCLIEAVV